MTHYNSFDCYLSLWGNASHEHFKEEWDAVVCIGPNDSDLITTLIPGIQRHVSPRRIYIITHPSVIAMHQNQFDRVEFVSEYNFPFSMQYIHDAFKTHERSGWYFQQLLKLYAPLVIPAMKSQYVIVDADVRFHKDVRFFERDKIQFNVGTEYHIPYFQHMERLLGISKKTKHSGICHMMPMKRHLVQALIDHVEQKHGTLFWKAFLDKVDPIEYRYSGASEYEMLLNFALVHFPNEVEIQPLQWQNTGSKETNQSYDYEAYHWYGRH